MNTSGQGSEFGRRTADAFNREEFNKALINKSLRDEHATLFNLEVDEVVVDGPTPKLDVDDMVNHPSHYNSHPSGVECIEIIRHHNNDIGMAIKYLWRNGLKREEGMSKKEKQIEDINKAIFFLKDEIYRLENF